MSSRVYPFPISRRVRFIRKQAGRMIEMSAAAGERYLRRALDLQAATMRRRGIPAPMISRELAAMEAAIRAELWKLVLTGGVA